MGATRRALQVSRAKDRALPSRDELLAFVREKSGKVGTREIARAFGAKNADRAALKRMLRELADAGQIEHRRKRLHQAGALPPVVLADITGRDSDGEFLARPTEWDEQAHGAAPVIHIVRPRRARPGEAAGVGDRALLRIERAGEETTGRVIKLIDRAKHRVLGIFRGLPGGGGRLGLPSGSVVERLGSIKSERAVSLIAIHAHGIPQEFSRAALAEAAAAQPATTAGR